MKWAECGWFPESVDLGVEGEREADGDQTDAVHTGEATGMSDGEDEEDVPRESSD